MTKAGVGSAGTTGRRGMQAHCVGSLPPEVLRQLPAGTRHRMPGRLAMRPAQGAAAWLAGTKPAPAAGDEPGEAKSWSSMAPRQAWRRVRWRHLNEVLVRSWSHSTELANWALQTLLAHDVTRDPETRKLGPMPANYLYGKREFRGWSKSAIAVLRTTAQACSMLRHVARTCTSIAIEEGG